MKMSQNRQKKTMENTGSPTANGDQDQDQDSKAKNSNDETDGLSNELVQLSISSDQPQEPCSSTSARGGSTHNQSALKCPPSRPLSQPLTFPLSDHDNESRPKLENPNNDDKIFYWNIQGIRKHQIEKTQVTETILDELPSIFCLAETWLYIDQNCGFVNNGQILSYYTIHQINGTKKKLKGNGHASNGMIIGIRKSISSEWNTHFDQYHVKLTHTGNIMSNWNSNMTIIFAYIPPLHSTNIAENKSNRETLSTIIGGLVGLESRFILIGDLNGNCGGFLQCDSNTELARNRNFGQLSETRKSIETETTVSAGRGKQLADLIKQYELLIVNGRSKSDPYGMATSTRTQIDLCIITSCVAAFVKDFSVTEVNPDLFDHKYIQLSIGNTNEPEPDVTLALATAETCGTNNIKIEKAEGGGSPGQGNRSMRLSHKTEGTNMDNLLEYLKRIEQKVDEHNDKTNQKVEDVLKILEKLILNPVS